MPRDGRAPVVTGDHSGICAERVQQTDHIAYQVKQRVLLDGLGAIGLAVAAHIWRDDPKASFRERLKLVPPGIPRFRESMAQQHSGPEPHSAMCMRIPFVSMKRCLSSIIVRPIGG